MPYKQRVRGSNPCAPTLIFKGLRSFLNVAPFSFAYDLHKKGFKRNTERPICENLLQIFWH